MPRSLFVTFLAAAFVIASAAEATTEVQQQNPKRAVTKSPRGTKPPPSAEGTTIPHCGSGDPLQGLNVHKSESSARPKGPDCVPF